MFSSDSRYLNQPTAVFTAADGSQLSYVLPPLPAQSPRAGYYRSVGQERLDLVALRYLNAPRGFWRLCDANNSPLAGALVARALIAIPQSGTP
ncbi:MAG TPA: hypothetical protein VMD59_06830 [Acidimicrobiales bacterium]|nr:hypothetical protein [Acidimicrobiales bacterium]